MQNLRYFLAGFLILMLLTASAIGGTLVISYLYPELHIVVSGGISIGLVAVSAIAVERLLKIEE